MSAEAGHAPNRSYRDQSGNLHLGGANLFDANENAFAQSVSFAIAKGGSSNICLVTMTLLDGAGNTLAGTYELDWWLSDDAGGNGLTATTASGTVAAGSKGFDFYSKVSKKAGQAGTDKVTGQYILSITDTAKTGFYVSAVCPGTGKTFTSRQLVSGDYD